MLFGRKKQVAKIDYDPATQHPAIRQSICTGEMVGGIVDDRTGKFFESMLIRDQRDREEFAARVGMEPDQLKVFY